MSEIYLNLNLEDNNANEKINKLDNNLEGVASSAKKAENALNDATDSTERLEASLKKQENNIKVLDGAINIIGGSVEVLAGGLALSGALTEEQAEQFETAAIGAIAFADGTKRIMDGYKTLNEGLVEYGGIAGAARKAQLALNTAILANPYVAAAAAIAALTAGIYLFVRATDEQAKKQRELNAISQEATENTKTQIGELMVLQDVLNDVGNNSFRFTENIKRLGELIPAIERLRQEGLQGTILDLDKINQLINEEIELIKERGEVEVIYSKINDLIKERLDLEYEQNALNKNRKAELVGVNNEINYYLQLIKTKSTSSIFGNTLADGEKVYSNLLNVNKSLEEVQKLLSKPTPTNVDEIDEYSNSLKAAYEQLNNLRTENQGLFDSDFLAQENEILKQDLEFQEGYLESWTEKLEEAKAKLELVQSQANQGITSPQVKEQLSDLRYEVAVITETVNDYSDEIEHSKKSIEENNEAIEKYNSLNDKQKATLDKLNGVINQTTDAIQSLKSVYDEIARRATEGVVAELFEDLFDTSKIDVWQQYLTSKGLLDDFIDTSEWEELEDTFAEEGELSGEVFSDRFIWSVVQGLEGLSKFTKDQTAEFNRALAVTEQQQLELRRHNVEMYYDNLINLAGDNVELVAELEKAKTQVIKDEIQTRTDLQKFYASEEANAIQGTLDTAAQFTRTLSEVQDESTEQAFENAKKYKKAEVVTSALQSSFQAFGAAQQFGPVLGPILGAAQVAAIALAANKAIQDIQNSSFENPNANLAGGSVGSVANVGSAFNPNNSLGQVPEFTESQMLRAYVLGGDVEDADAAARRLSRRRKL